MWQYLFYPRATFGHLLYLQYYLSLHLLRYSCYLFCFFVDFLCSHSCTKALNIHTKLLNIPDKIPPPIPYNVRTLIAITDNGLETYSYRIYKFTPENIINTPKITSHKLYAFWTGQFGQPQYTHNLFCMAIFRIK